MTQEWPDRYVLDRAYRLGDDAPVSIAVAGGEIQEVCPPPAAPPWPRYDLAGRVVLPGLVDAHQHLDKTHLYPALGNESGTLDEAIARVREHYARCTVDEIVGRARRGLDLAIAAGTTAVRSHADTGSHAGLRGVEALLRLRSEYHDRVRLQVVAMASVEPDGSLGVRDVLEAVRMGVDAVGGAPWRAAHAALRASYVHRLFDVAEAAGRPVDLHADESLDPDHLTLVEIARRARASGLGGRVVVGHCCSLAALSDARAEAAIAEVAAAGLHVVTLPAVNLFLQARAHAQPTPRGVTRVRQLLAAGVNVAAASDNVRDPFYPFGDGDLLRTAALTCVVAHLSGRAGMEAALAMVTERAARAIGLAPSYGLRPGARADLVVLDHAGPSDAGAVLASQPGRRLVLCGGRPAWPPAVPMRAMDGPRDRPDSGAGRSTDGTAI